MRNVQVSDLLGLFGTILPNVGAENLTASGKDDVSASVMSLKLSAAIFVNLDIDFFALEHLEIAF